MVYSYQDVIPVIDPSAYVHELATIIGKVTIGKNVFIGPGAVLRADFGEIILEDGCNVQENCVIHMFPNLQTILREGAHVGHGAVIHGAELGKNCMIGMNAVIMDRVVVGHDSIVGALSFVPSEMDIPPRSLVVGSPAKIIKQVSDEMIAWKTEGTRIYQNLPEKYRDHLKKVNPLRDSSLQKDLPKEEYPIWPERNE